MKFSTLTTLLLLSPHAALSRVQRKRAHIYPEQCNRRYDYSNLSTGEVLKKYHDFKEARLRTASETPSTEGIITKSKDALTNYHHTVSTYRPESYRYSSEHPASHYHASTHTTPPTKSNGTLNLDGAAFKPTVPITTRTAEAVSKFHSTVDKYNAARHKVKTSSFGIDTSQGFKTDTSTAAAKKTIFGAEPRRSEAYETAFPDKFVTDIDGSKYKATAISLTAAYADFPESRLKQILDLHGARPYDISDVNHSLYVPVSEFTSTDQLRGYLANTKIRNELERAKQAGRIEAITSCEAEDESKSLSDKECRTTKKDGYENCLESIKHLEHAVIREYYQEHLIRRLENDVKVVTQYFEEEKEKRRKQKDQFIQELLKKHDLEKKKMREEFELTLKQEDVLRHSYTESLQREKKELKEKNDKAFYTKLDKDRKTDDLESEKTELQHQLSEANNRLGVLKGTCDVVTQHTSELQAENSKMKIEMLGLKSQIQKQEADLKAERNINRMLRDTTLTVGCNARKSRELLDKFGLSGSYMSTGSSAPVTSNPATTTGAYTNPAADIDLKSRTARLQEVYDAIQRDTERYRIRKEKCQENRLEIEGRWEEYNRVREELLRGLQRRLDSDLMPPSLPY